ncbi:MAG: hypothetical protein HY819_11200 [Acidobacteria bacterium]|nr:hypothetical protein [Acidobacteriota bacterium]
MSISLLFVLAFTTFAQQNTNTPKVAKRQKNQQERIADGVKDGELTKKEAAKLEAREAKIQQDKKEAKADGKVTKKEKAKLDREQDRASRKIYKQKHDAQTNDKR